MAGAPKGPLLHEIKPHLFFDDQVCLIWQFDHLCINVYRLPMFNRVSSLACLPRTCPGALRMSRSEEMKIETKVTLLVSYICVC